MSDGAHLGFSAEESLKAVLGDDESDEQKMTSEQMAAYLDSAPDEPVSYDDVSCWAGRGVLRYLREHPEAFSVGDAGDVFNAAFPHTTASFSETYPPLEGITGFMVGWAVNAARFACGRNALPNPAIVTFESE